MILHLANDEKFINSAMDLFEGAAPGNNQFLIYKEHLETPCIHVSTSPRSQIVPLDVAKTAALIDGWSNAQALVVHLLTPFAAKTLLALKGKLPVLWLAWGADVYDSTPTLQWRLYQPRTLRYLSPRWPHRPIWYSALVVRCILQKLGIHRNQLYRNHFRAIKTCMFCAPVFPTENELIRKHCAFQGEFLRFSYGDYANESMTFDLERPAARDILVGNSSSTASNHLDAFALLKRLNLKDRKVFVPLSYGDADYRRFVLREGPKMLGDRFVPIVDFVPIEEYALLIKTCGIYIFNHWRQQAGGNILMGLWNGARVFLPKKNPGYSYFKDLGVSIFNLNEELTQELLDNPLDRTSIQTNRSIVKKEYGRDAVLRRARDVIRTLTAEA